MSAPWYLYVLECERGVLYIGITTDVEARFCKHAQGKGAVFTRMNRPLRILGAASFPDRSEATRAELALKKKSRGEKLRWVSENRLPSAPRAATKREVLVAFI